MSIEASNVYQKVKGDIAISTSVEPRTSDLKMKALAWYGSKDVRLIETNVPKITDPSDCIIKVTGTTVCGSDLHLYHKEIFQLQKGDILGHEFVGIVVEKGPDCKLEIGQRVVNSFQIACGKCEYCKKGLSSMCDTTNNSQVMNSLYGHRFAGMFGYGHFTSGFPGGQAEYVRIPFADVNLLPLPNDVPDDKGIFLSDILCTSFHACTEANIEKGSSVCIFGCGPIGLICCYFCKLMGADRVIAIDDVPERLEKAKILGAEPLNFDGINVVETVQKMIPGGVDRCIDCAGFRYAKGFLHKVERAIGLETDTSETLNEMVKLVKKFGYVVLISDYAAYTNHFNIGAVMEKGIRLIGSGQCPVQKYWKDILEKYLRTGMLDKLLQTVVTHRFKLDDIVELYSKFDRKEFGIIKTFVETKFSAPPSSGMPKLTDIHSLG